MAELVPPAPFEASTFQEVRPQPPVLATTTKPAEPGPAANAAAELMAARNAALRAQSLPYRLVIEKDEAGTTWRT